ncbi:chemotaxis protein CheY [Anopheles sinensis]|uniref:Chemotaxis protein CheY n=1 Tax=Anopheles sinensis TaxID=74873 RepID=A0A084VSK3_ANOSI|nr:chemotaxis protein CheY [Anopheles sinensis]
MPKTGHETPIRRSRHERGIRLIQDRRSLTTPMSVGVQLQGKSVPTTRRNGQTTLHTALRCKCDSTLVYGGVRRSYISQRSLA